MLGDDGTETFDEYTNSALVPQEITAMDGSTYYRKPQFDIEVSAQKASPYNKMSQNEFAIQCYQQQFFNPQNADATLACLNMMDFDHKEDVISTVQQNGTLLDMVMQQQEQINKLQVLCDLAYGSNLTGNQNTASSSLNAVTTSTGQAPTSEEITSALGDTSNSITSGDGTNSQAEKMRRAVADSTEV
jgi:hypothetical protein